MQVRDENKKVVKKAMQSVLKEIGDVSERDASIIERYFNYMYVSGYEKGIKLLNKRGVKRPVYQLKDGQVIKEHESLSQAARAINGNPESILRVIQGRRFTYKGYQWFYKDQLNH